MCITKEDFAMFTVLINAMQYGNSPQTPTIKAETHAYCDAEISSAIHSTCNRRERGNERLVYSGCSQCFSRCTIPQLNILNYLTRSHKSEKIAAEVGSIIISLTNTFSYPHSHPNVSRINVAKHGIFPYT